MKIYFSFFLILCMSAMAHSQVFNVQYGDSTYQKPFYWQDTVLIEWEVKDSLPKGVYWFIKEYQCGIDTLTRAEFIEDGVKHGSWIRYDRPMCHVKMADGYEPDNAEKKDEIAYDSGFLVSYSYLFYESGIPRLTYFYDKGKTDTDDWGKEVWYYENGNEQEVMSRFGFSSIFVAYYQNGLTKYNGSLYEPRTDFWEWTFFHDNGFFRAEGKYTGERPIDRTSYHEDQLLQVGKWVYWDKNGKLIAKAWFGKGGLLRVRLKKRAKQSFEEINKDFKDKPVIIRQ